MEKKSLPTVIRSFPLTEGAIKTNVKKQDRGLMAAPPPPPKPNKKIHYEPGYDSNGNMVEISIVSKVENNLSTDEAFALKRHSMSDEKLIELAHEQLSELCKTGGRSFRMTVPVRVEDTDMIFSELLRRFESTLK